MTNALPPGFELLPPSAAAPALPPGFDLVEEPAAPAPAQSPYPTSALSASTAGVAAGLTGNFFDEISAGAMTPIEIGIGAYTGADRGKPVLERIGDAYDRALAKGRAYEAAQREAHPVAATVGDVAGALATGGTLAKGGATLLNVAKPTLPAMAGRAAAEGAIYGGVYGAGAGEGAENRAYEALKGAAIGTAAGGALGAVGARSAANAQRAAVPTTEDIRASAQAAYKASEDAGVILKPDAMKALQQNVRDKLVEFGYHPRMQPMASAAVKELDRLAAEGAPVTLKGLDTLRKMATRANNPMNQSEDAVSGRIVDEIDGLIGRIGPDDALPGSNVTQGAEALKEARSSWARAAKAQTIEDAVLKGERRAQSTGSGGNTENAIRQNIRGILDSPKKSRGFSAAEREAMEKVVRGSPVQNIARLIGKLSPEGNGLMLALNTGAGVADPRMLALTAAGAGSKRVAEALARLNVESLEAIVRSGGVMPELQQLSGPRRAVIEALLKQSATAPAQW